MSKYTLTVNGQSRSVDAAPDTLGVNSNAPAPAPAAIDTATTPAATIVLVFMSPV